MYIPDPDEKFDFQNMDVKLYLALKALIVLAEEEAQSLDYLGREDDATQEAANNAKHLVEQAVLALTEFEQSFGPIPDWATARNFGYEIKEGTQLLTRDGRRMGNAYIVQHAMVTMPELADRTNPFGEVPVFHCLTDAGSKFTMMEKELLGQFHIGDWLCDPARIIRDFDRNGEFVEEPK